MARQPWCFRQYPSCHTTFPGGQLRPVRFGGGHWHQEGVSLRECPNYGHQGVTQYFPVVALQQV